MAPNAVLEAIRKEQIIEAALATIAEKGFQNVTLDEVAKAAGMSKGGLVHYFPTKDTLFRESVVVFFAGIFERGRRTRDEVDDPLEQLLSFTWLYDPDDRDLATGYRLFFDFAALASQDPVFRRLYHEWVENWIALLVESLAEGNRRGSFRVADPPAMARTISAIYQGIAERWYLDREGHTAAWAVDSLRRSVAALLAAI
ncbi:MAG: TetR/AcrR family transcriptional regulator [Deltaproteobacteria bacterium]|nr:TetR/AcrR family transcriptional regulator [Deltaproteobacteria bacterium]